MLKFWKKNHFFIFFTTILFYLLRECSAMVRYIGRSNMLLEQPSTKKPPTKSGVYFYNHQAARSIILPVLLPYHHPPTETRVLRSFYQIECVPNIHATMLEFELLRTLFPNHHEAWHHETLLAI